MANDNNRVVNVDRFEDLDSLDTTNLVRDLLINPEKKRKFYVF